jgi:hypothetical protein
MAPSKKKQILNSTRGSKMLSIFDEPLDTRYNSDEK